MATCDGVYQPLSASLKDLGLLQEIDLYFAKINMILVWFYVKLAVLKTIKSRLVTTQAMSEAD